MTVQYFDFLDVATLAELRGLTVGAVWTRMDQPNFRKAAICTEWDGFALFFEAASKRLDLFDGPPFEVQLTRMVDGEFLGVHQDAQYGGDDSAPLTTFVYYMGDRASFTGGRLLMGDDAVEPVDNSLVIFDGLANHAIEPLQGRDAQRFTINGCYKQ